MANNKDLKEAFVSDCEGTSLLEIYLLVIVSSLGLLVRHTTVLCSDFIQKWHSTSLL